MQIRAPTARGGLLLYNLSLRNEAETVTITEVITAAAGGGGILCILMTAVQISKIQINPWSWLARHAGRAINGEVMDQIGKINEKIDRLETDIGNARMMDEQRDIEQRRVRILRFGEEILRNARHTKEHFDQILIDTTKYENYCRDHPDFQNDVTVETIQHIKSVYKKCWEEHSFL